MFNRVLALTTSTGSPGGVRLGEGPRQVVAAGGSAAAATRPKWPARMIMSASPEKQVPHPLSCGLVVAE